MTTELKELENVNGIHKISDVILDDIEEARKLRRSPMRPLLSRPNLKLVPLKNKILQSL